MTRPNPSNSERFPYAGMTVFALFFGASLLEAVSGAHWARVLFWTAMGLVFLLLDRGRQQGKHRE